MPNTRPAIPREIISQKNLSSNKVRMTDFNAKLLLLTEPNRILSKTRSLICKWKLGKQMNKVRKLFQSKFNEIKKLRFYFFIPLTYIMMVDELTSKR